MTPTPATILCADVLAGLGKLGDDHFSSCVCDPPYELGFMGKKWDSSGISYSVEMWREVFRVLKPGAHLLAFGGSRTYHRLACAIEDAGFQIRDQIMWIYGSGFPKSRDVGKDIEKIKVGGIKNLEVIGERKGLNNEDGTHGFSYQKEYVPGVSIGGKQLQGTIPVYKITNQWEGFGTALKPAHEPIVVARKPLEGTVAANVLKHGTGAINVAGCRIEGPEPHHNYGRTSGEKSFCGEGLVSITPQDGRWPANVIHDGSDEVLAHFPDSGQSGKCYDYSGEKEYQVKGFIKGNKPNSPSNRGDTGSAARFFYCAKASPAERNLGCEGLEKRSKQVHICQSEGRKMAGQTKSMPTRNNHPTVKPIALMAYLVRLVTPPGGVVLDPFMGSGSTLIAAAKEGFDSVGIDKEAAYCELAEARCRGQLGMLAEIETEAP